MRFNFKKSALSAVTAIVSLVMAASVPAIAHAAVDTADVSAVDLSATPFVTYTGVSVDQDMVCFSFDSADPNNNNVMFNDLVFSGTLNNAKVSIPLQNKSLQPQDGVVNVCTLDEYGSPIAGIGNPLDYTSIALSGRTVLPSSISDSFNTLLKAQGLSLDVSSPKPGFNFNPFNGTQFWAQVANTGKKTVAVRLTNAKFDGIPLSMAATDLVVDPGTSQYLDLGGTDLDVSGGHTNADLTATIKKLVLSTVDVKGITAPKGIKISSTPSDWYYINAGNGNDPSVADTTSICLMLTNTTSAPIAIEAKLAASATGKKAVAQTGSSVDVIAAKGTQCVSGNYDNTKSPRGDWRVASAVKLTGTLKVVKASTVSTAGIKLPTGFKVSHTQFLYDAATKKTTAVLAVVTPKNFQDDLRFDSVSADGTKIASSVSGPCQCGGPGYVAPRVLQIRGLAGDLRIGKTIVVKATATTATPITFNNGTSPGNNQYYCAAYYPQEWSYSAATNKTAISLICFNGTGTDETIDVSALTLKVTTDAGSTDYTPVVNSVAIPAHTRWQVTTIFSVTGDVRTGGATVDLNGDMK